MKQILKFILNHPLGSKKPMKAIFRFFYWQVSYRIFKKKELVFSVTEKTRMILKPSLAGASGNYYCGLLEFEDMAFCLHYLSKKDTFFDVGSNVGIYTILASAHVGCKTVAFEPDTVTINHLRDNIQLNNIKKLVSIEEKVVGETNGYVKFSVAKDTINHVVNENDLESTFQNVKMTFLDYFLVQKPKMIKIDVEGFEWNVLNGAKQLLLDSNLEAIIIEINGSGKYFDVDDSSLHQLLTENGFNPFSYEPFERKLTPLSTFGNLNTIYLRNIDSVKLRLATSESFESFGINI
jgi:FkbM family methyltransferase